MSHKLDKDLGDIENLLNELSAEAPRVIAATQALVHQIFNGIQEYSLTEGSHVVTTVLDELTSSERQRVLSSIVGRYFENQKSQTQYKVVPDGKRIALKKEEVAVPHIHIPPPK